MYPSRFARCLQLLNLLQSRIGYSTWELAHDLEVSRRTIYRDLCLLKGAGIRVFFDSTIGRYHVERDANLKTSPLTDDELIALLLAAHVSSLSCGETLGRLIRQSVGKLLKQLPTRLREEASRLLSAIARDAPAPWLENDATVSEIVLAIRQKRRVRIAYRTTNGSGDLLRTKITPYQLVTLQGNWQLVGRSSLHRKVCRFDLRHICHVERVIDNCHSTRASPHEIAVSSLIM